MKFLGQRPNIGLVVLIMSSGCLGCGGSGGTSGVGGAAGGMAGRLGSGGDGLGGSGAGSGGSGVSGSAGADAGSGGGSQPDAASSDGAVGTCYPACLESLLAQCPKTLVCTQQAYTSGQTFKCYTNGVIDETRPNQVERLQANGDFCLTIYTSTDVGDQYAHEDFFQGNGVPTVDVPVARLQLTAQANQYVVTCLADGSTADVDLTAPQCATYYAEQQQPCVTGVCN